MDSSRYGGRIEHDVHAETNSMKLQSRFIFMMLVFLVLETGCATTPAPVETPPAARPFSMAVGSHTNNNAAAYYYFISAQMKMKAEQVSEAQWLLEKAVQLDPHSTVIRMELANVHSYQKQNDKALQLIHAILVDHPDSSEALVFAGRVYQQRGNLQEAKALFERAIVNDPPDPNIYLYLGRIYWNVNDLANAERIFRRMVSNFPDSYAAHYFIGKVLGASGKYDQALKAFQHSLDLEPSFEEPRFEMVKIYKSLHNTDAVIKTYQEILEYYPGNIEAAMELALHYRNTKRPELGLALLADLGQRSEMDNNVLTHIFETYLETKQYETAAWVIDGMLEGAPGSSDLHYLAGVAYGGLKQAPKALHHLAQVSSQSRFFNNAVVHRALLLRNAGDMEQAIHVVQAAMAHDSDNPDYYLYLGSFYEEGGRYDEAQEILLRGLAIDDANERLHFRLGVVQDKAGRKQEAIQSMRRVLEVVPDDVEALNYLGYTFADMGIHLDEAESLIKRALEKKPDDGYIIDSLAWVYYKKGAYRQALRWLEKAVSLVPDDPVILEHLGDVLEKLDRRKEALERYQHSLDLKSDDRRQLEEKIRAINLRLSSP